MTDQQIKELADAAIAARANAYAPFSGFAAGAAVLAADGRVFCGVNVENSSYGLTICAERIAFGAAVTAGARDFAAVAIATDNGAPPCGACRQFMHEFGERLAVLLVDTSSGQPPKQMALAELLPGAFRFEPRG